MPPKAKLLDIRYRHRGTRLAHDVVERRATLVDHVEIGIRHEAAVAHHLDAEPCLDGAAGAQRVARNSPSANGSACRRRTPLVACDSAMSPHSVAVPCPLTKPTASAARFASSSAMLIAARHGLRARLGDMAAVGVGGKADDLAWMARPRARACSRSSSISVPAPSPMTRPSRSRSKGRGVVSGVVPCAVANKVSNTAAIGRVELLGAAGDHDAALPARIAS